MLPHLSTQRIQRLAAGVAATLVCGWGVYVLGQALDPHYPIKEWLIWRLAPIWGYAILFDLSGVAFGSFLLRRLLGQRELPAIERLLQSMMLGLTAFVLGLYAAGFVGLLKPWLAVLLPLTFLAVGESDGRALLAELFAWRGAVPEPKRVERVLGSLAIALGAAALFFLYLEALDISAINFDATWYHFPIAQDYARVGRIIPFPGENHRAFPHLTSMVHTWALLVPGLSQLTQHWMLSLHLEFTIVVWRIVAAATLARWLLGGRDVRGLWAGFFLFPSIFVYDQQIGGSADNFLGFFAVPALLAAGRAFKRFELRWCVLLGVALGGHMLVKYQAAYLIAGVGVATLVSACLLGVRRFLSERRIAAAGDWPSYRALLKGAAAVGLSMALVSAPHFAKNAVFYRNPVYPFATKVFKSTFPPPVPGYYEEKSTKGVFLPQYSGLRRQAWALGRVFQYSLTTANRNLTKHRPYMGALFSLLLPCTLFVRGRRRLLFTAGITAVAFMLWANTAANDRYLIAFHDLCIGTALALLVKVWELGWPARVGLTPLVLLQLVWGGDAMLLYGKKQLDAGIDLITAGYSGRYDERFAAKSVQLEITKATPKNAVILSRNWKGLLGLNRLVLSDIQANQDYVVYSNLKDPRDFYDLLKTRGITHLMYPRGDRRPGRWNNTLLFAEIFRRGPSAKRIGKIHLNELPREPPPHSAPYLVLVSGQREYPDGVYKLEQLDVDYRDPAMFTPKPVPFKAASASDAAELVPRLQAVVMCRGRLPRGWSKALLEGFDSIESFDGCEYHLRPL
jgi:hypothetical protein